MGETQISLQVKKPFCITAIGVIIAAIGFTLLNLETVVWRPYERFVSANVHCKVVDSKQAAYVELSKDSYLLKLEYANASGAKPLRITLNGHEVKANTYPGYVHKRSTDVIYVNISKDIVAAGSNCLRIVFSKSVAIDLHASFSNYRKCFGGNVYIAYRDSLVANSMHELRYDTLSLAYLLLFSVGTALIYWGRSRALDSSRTDRARARRCQTLMALFQVGLLVILSLCQWFDYIFMVTPEVVAVSSMACIAVFLFNSRAGVWESSSILGRDFLLSTTSFNTRSTVALGLLIVIINCLLYAPCLFHIFRHDDWFLFYSSRFDGLGWKFIVDHIDWQLKLPYDRLMFRPLSHSAMALNRSLFDANYVGPHVLALAKHLISVMVLWWLMWQISPRRISGIFALLFSVLITNIDAITWPHLDSYVVATIITLIIVVYTKKTIDGKISGTRGYLILTICLFFNLLTSEITVFMPGILFATYWLLFRKGVRENKEGHDRGIWCVLLLPYISWLLLYAIHVYAAYPDISFAGQSGTIGLFKPIYNVLRILIVLLSDVLFPVLTTMVYADKVYVETLPVGIIMSLVIIGVVVKTQKKSFKKPSRFMVFVALLMLSILLVLSFGRASYLDHMLDRNRIATHYSYCLTALAMIMIYSSIKFEKIDTNVRSGAMYGIIILLLLTHAIKTNRTLRDVEFKMRPLKKYYDSVSQFVSEKCSEVGTTFKMIDRPPEIEPFSWYSQTCVDGVFARYIDYEKPTYLLEYDRKTECLMSSLYDRRATESRNEQGNNRHNVMADYENEIGIKFKQIGVENKPIYVGCFEVTQKEWRTLMDFNPSQFVNMNYPVENVSYWDVMEFIKKLNRNESGVNYRLPTRDEYSYMCRDVEDDFQKYGWLKLNSKAKTHTIGSRESLSGGLYDIIGNVWEWTATALHHDTLTGHYKDNPRLCFGGSWRDDASHAASLETNYPPDFVHHHLGFRLIAYGDIIPARN